jgi:hypothetical protein
MPGIFFPETHPAKKMIKGRIMEVIFFMGYFPVLPVRYRAAKQWQVLEK